MGFLKIEQETQISFNAAEDKAELYTADPEDEQAGGRKPGAVPRESSFQISRETLCNALHSAQEICSYSYKRQTQYNNGRAES